MTIFKNLSFCYVVHNLHETKKCFLVASGSETTHVQTKVTISRRDIIKCFINITNKIDISEKQSFTCHTIHHIILEAVPSYFIQKVTQHQVLVLLKLICIIICLSAYSCQNVYLMFYYSFRNN
jgi:hypothetical protein